MRLSFVLIILLSIPTIVSAIPLGDNVYIAFPPDSIQCIDILLPDDLGVFSPGLVDYEIVSDAAWGDLTTQKVSTDENNSVRVPICFSSFGRKIGECSPPFSLTIAAPLLQESRGFGGGICISDKADVDYTSSLADPKEVLSTHADVFDLSFSPSVPVKGEPLTLHLQSSSAITLDIDITGMQTQTVSLSPDHQSETIEFTPEGDVQATARVRGCADSICTKTVVARVRDPATQTGFTAQLFPRSLDVKTKDPVTFTLTVQNFDVPRDFQVSLSLPDGLRSGFTTQSIHVEKQQDLAFQVLPENSSALYLFSVTVSSESSQKTLSASLSTNELLTDISRFAEDVKQSNPTQAEKVDVVVENWYDTYASTPAGSELDAYGSVQKSLEGAKDTSTPLPVESPVEVPIEELPSVDDSSGGEFPILWVGLAGGGIGVAVLLIFLMRRPKEITVPELES